MSQKYLTRGRGLYRRLLPFFLGVAAFLCGLAPVLSAPLSAQQTAFDHFPGTEVADAHITAVLQDHVGFMWIGTQGDGLYRYDGYRFQAYEAQTGDSQTLPNSNITSLYEDAAGSLWVTTWEGVSRYDRKTDRFETWTTGDSTPWSNVVHQDAAGTIWIGTMGGLFTFDQTRGNVAPAAGELGDAVGGSAVLDLLESDDGLLWVATSAGLLVQDPEASGVAFVELPNSELTGLQEDDKGRIWASSRNAGIGRLDRGTTADIRWYKHDPEDPSSLAIDAVLTLHSDRQGRLWVGTENGGLDRYDEAIDGFIHIRADADESTSLSHPSVWAIHEDRIGDLWVGTFAGGLNVLRNAPPAIELFRSRPGTPGTLKSNAVKALHEDPQGRLWVGTDGGGFHLFDAETRTFQRYNSTNTELTSDAVLSLFTDADGYLWVGTWAGGLGRFDPTTSTFESFYHQADGLPAGNIFGITQDASGAIWALDFAGGLVRIDPVTRSVRVWDADSSGLVDNYNLALAKTPEGELLIASQSYGLVSFDPVNESFTRIDRDPSTPRGVTDGNVRALAVSGDFVWFGTETGLTKLDRRTGDIERFSTDNGLPGNTVVGVTVAADGVPWIATNRGLCRFDIDAQTCSNYTINDNLQGNRFNAFVNLTTRDGQLLFGGPSGLNIIHPDRLQINEEPPPVVFTDFQLFNKSVSPADPGSILSEHISVASHVTVSHRQSVLTFEYAALDFTNPAKNQYAYKLEGFDEGWHAVGTRRTATYSNLDPGDYELVIQASNSDGVWNEDGARLGITVLPAYWQTSWFKALLGFLGLGLLVGLLRGAHYFGQVGTIKQKLKVEEELRASAQAANLAKDQFLANMSHEIRTPMNGVMGMIELTLDSPLTPAQREYLTMASSSAESLLTIINDILDFSKIEAGMLGIESTPFDVRKKIGTTAKSLAFRAQDKGLELAIDVTPGVPELISGDPVRLSQILVNLVGNAIKFTETGEVTVSVEPWAEAADTADDGGLTLHFAVRDTGIGIPEDRQTQIFDAFVQADMSTTRFYGGTGLGLVICARLVELMGGRIWVESTPGVGSVFHFTARFDAPEQPARSFALAAPPALEGLPVLVVDDNETNRFILERMLNNWGMKPELVDNGPGAAEMFTAAEVPPYSLVLLDYQMPGMDGLEVARSIRSKWRADQVALVMLTSVHEMHLAEQIVALDVAVHVVKPFTQSEVLDGILSVISSPSAAGQKDAKPVSDADASADKPLRILLVEDNQVNRTLATRILESAGHKVETAWDGNLAIEAVRTRDYDLVLMDMQMPVMDGFESTRHIRELENGRRVPIVALTARAMEGDEQKCLEAGMDGYLSKPVRMAELREMVLRVTKGAHSTA